MTPGKNPEVRVIPVVLVKNGNVVQSYGFDHHPIIGGVQATLERLLNFQADEVIILDISGNPSSRSLAISRPDIGQIEPKSGGLEGVLVSNAGSVLYPLTVGGGIREVRQAENLVALGADKVVVNWATLHNHALIKACVSRLGTQAVVASVDVIEVAGGFAVFDYSTRSQTVGVAGFFDFLHSLEEIGCGEIFLNNVSRDGKRVGQNLELIASVAEAVSIPVITCGGIGTREDFVDATRAGASAVAAANFFHSHELSYPFVKKEMAKAVSVREYVPQEDLLHRELPADESYNKNLARTRLKKASQLLDDRYRAYRSQPVEFKRCARCLYPLHAATSLTFSREDLCSGCERFTDAQSRMPNRNVRVELTSILASRRSRPKNSEYDCVVAVSGGKDSYFQTHYVINELGLKPLLVTYDANNWTEIGLENLRKMKTAFGVDHLIVAPPDELLKNMNLAGFLMMGDMSWHAHVGIFSSPMKVAVELGIPFVFYGEHGREDLAGQFRYGDFPEINYRERLEHLARGFEWTAFSGLFGIKDWELEYWRYPSDAELFDSEVRGLHLGSFIAWDPHRQTELVRSLYGFQLSDVGFDRTYRRGSNLDDMHENGVHDWLKYVKFGYGRATDHASKDIRFGKLDRESALGLVKRHDPALPSDIERWLPYAGISREMFFAVSNTFRSESVWRFNGESWEHPEGMLDDWASSPSNELDTEFKNLNNML